MNIFRSLCRRLSPAARDETGLTLIEILVAMTIFAIISVGVALGVTASLVNVRDAQDRETAVNLAASQIDLVRSVDDIFTVNDLPQSKTIVVGGVTFRVDRKTNWVTNSSTTAACGADAGGNTLRYKRVNVSVSWDGMRNTDVPAMADTILAPNSRINDPTKGTILVHVIGANGSGMPGVAVNAVPTTGVSGNTAAALTVTPAATDVQGCSYILKVTPGTYDVTISKSGYISSDQSLNSATTTVGVVAGASASAGFQFDNAGLFTTNFAVNAPASPPVLLPSNLDVSYLNSYGIYVAKATTGVAKLHPFADGYTMLAGKYVDPTLPSGGCASVDPLAWPSTVVAGVTYAGQRPAPVAAAPGAAPPAAARVPMGVVTVALDVTKGKSLNAVSQATAPGTGDPGCAVGVTYSFTLTTTGNYTIALPYGSWKLYQATTTTGTTNQVGTSGMTPVNTKVVLTGSNVITFDPRGPVS